MLDGSISGFTDPRFDAVAETFKVNLDSGADVGASFCATVEGEIVVDLWGGFADEAKARPWERDTIVNVYSTTKTMAALCALVLADRGNPRALAFQFDQMGRLLQDAGGGAELVQHAHRLARTADGIVDAIAAATDPALATSRLPGTFKLLTEQTEAVSDQVTRRFFALLPAPQLVGMDLAG